MDKGLHPALCKKGLQFVSFLAPDNEQMPDVFIIVRGGTHRQHKPGIMYMREVKPGSFASAFIVFIKSRKLQVKYRGLDLIQT